MLLYCRECFADGARNCRGYSAESWTKSNATLQVCGWRYTVTVVISVPWPAWHFLCPSYEVNVTDLKLSHNLLSICFALRSSCCRLRLKCDGARWRTRPEESYRVWSVVVRDVETIMRPWPPVGLSATEKKIILITSNVYIRGSQPVLRGAVRAPRALPMGSAAASGKLNKNWMKLKNKKQKVESK